MDTARDLIFIVIGTAAITARIVAGLLIRADGPPPPIFRAQLPPCLAEASERLSPFLVLIAAIALALTLG